MSLQTLSGIPLQLVAGDTVLFTENFSDYPVGTWTAKLAISTGDKFPILVDATTSGANFLFTIDRPTSAGIQPGEYDFAIYVTASNQRTTAKTGTVTILPDLTQAIAPTFAETQVTLLEGALATLAASTSASVSFNGQSFSRANIADYQKQRTYYQAEVLREQNKLDAQRGAGDLGRVATRFIGPEGGIVDNAWPLGYTIP